MKTQNQLTAENAEDTKPGTGCFQFFVLSAFSAVKSFS